MASNAHNWSFGKVVGVSAGAGIVVLLILKLLLSFGLWTAFFWGLCVGLIVFVILWLNFSAEEDAARGVTQTTPASPAPAPASVAPAPSEAAPEPAPAPAPEAEAPEPAAPEAPAPADTDAASVIKPSKELPGQADLAARKGSWTYGGDTGAAPTPEPAAAATDMGEDYDKDGVQEGANEGEKPEMLSAAREGGADNLKEIKGVGPKMEQMLNEMGVYHFDQIAGWSADEVAWVDANLKGFKGRVSRDGWVEQAKILMTGAETEFSKRVGDGKVY